MAEFRHTDSGLVVPVEPPPKPQRQYGLMELQDKEAREKAQTILSELAQVMDLIHGTSGFTGILVDAGDVPAARRQAYGAIHHHLGELLLGDDNPGWEEQT